MLFRYKFLCKKEYAIDFGARNMCLTQGEVNASHSILWDAISYPSLVIASHGIHWDVITYPCQSPHMAQVSSITINFLDPLVNSLWSSDMTWCWWTGSSVVQVIACGLFDAKPLPKPMLTYYQQDHKERNSILFESLGQSE